MTQTAVADMAKKRPAEPDSKTVRISTAAYREARKVASLRAIDLSAYLSAIILAHAPKDLRAEIKKLGSDAE